MWSAFLGAGGAGSPGADLGHPEGAARQTVRRLGLARHRPGAPHIAVLFFGRFRDGEVHESSSRRRSLRWPGTTLENEARVDTRFWFFSEVNAQETTRRRRIFSAT